MTIAQHELKLTLGEIRTDDLQTQQLLLNQRQRSPRTMASAIFPALDHRIDTVGLGAPRPFQYSPQMNPANLRDVRPRAPLPVQDKCLAANVFHGFGRELAGAVFFMPKTYINLLD